jgi:2-polyprenyl-6-hydroxyphenyl methylase/3-demethylubiquinone-9 3-methyltransferase
MAEEIADRFAFGENWRRYATLVDADRIGEAEKSLVRYFGAEGLRGARFLDIGCGSGLFSLAAINLGASEVVAVDLDPNSVAAATAVLGKFAAGKSWQCGRDDILTMPVDRYGTFDAVYSWGVLHHTGAMHAAVEAALRFVRPGGRVLLALYGRTPFCGFWRWEKRCYVRYRPWFPVLARAIYKPLLLLRVLLSGRNPLRFLREYRTLRGMDWSHDVEDWLGGYPYESITPDAAIAFVESHGFRCEKSFSEKRIGIFGSGCDEYLFRRA